MRPCRLFRNITEIEKLSELGVLFLLFEMGLELSLDRLKVNSASFTHDLCDLETAAAFSGSRCGFDAQALAKYAFGLGLLQMVFSTAAFTLFSLPVGAGIGTIILERVCAAIASSH